MATYKRNSELHAFSLLTFSVAYKNVCKYPTWTCLAKHFP